MLQIYFLYLNITNNRESCILPSGVLVNMHFNGMALGEMQLSP